MLHIFVTLWTSKTFVKKRIYVSSGLHRSLSGYSEQPVNHRSFPLDLVFMIPADDEALLGSRSLCGGFLTFNPVHVGR